MLPMSMSRINFKDYFVNVARELEDKIPNSNINPLSYLGRLPNSFCFVGY